MTTSQDSHRVRRERLRAKRLDLVLSQRGEKFEIRDQSGDSLLATESIDDVEQWIGERTPGRAMTTTPSPEVARWITVQYAEGKVRRTVLERRCTLMLLERDLGCPAVEATAEQVAEWVTRDPSRSAMTVGSDLSKLRAFFGWAVAVALRPDDPTTHIKAPRRPRRQPRPISDAAFWRLDEAAESNESLRAMVRLAGLAGLRVAEVARFRTQDLDFEAATLTVVGKGGHMYVLPAHPAIIEHAALMPSSGYWFKSQRARHMGGRTVSQRLRLHMIRCRVSGTAHCLRHYFATELVYRGADLRVVQELMRHSRLSTTATYVGVTDQRKRDAIESLSKDSADGEDRK